MTAWNDFVKKIYHEGHNKDSSYQFKQALKDASKRKSEMGSSSSSSSSSKKMSRKSKKACMKSCKKSCRNGRRMKGGAQLPPPPPPPKVDKMGMKGGMMAPVPKLGGKAGGTRRRRK